MYTKLYFKVSIASVEDKARNSGAIDRKLYIIVSICFSQKLSDAYDQVINVALQEIKENELITNIELVRYSRPLDREDKND